jgi:phage-related minor tail protein
MSDNLQLEIDLKSKEVLLIIEYFKHQQSRNAESHEREIARLQADYSRQIVELKTKHAQEMDGIHIRIFHEYDDLKVKFAAEMEEYIHLRDEEMNDTKSKHDAQINDCRINYENEINSIKSTHDVELDNIKLKYREELDGWRSKMDQQYAIIQKLETAKSNLITVYAQELEDLKMTYDKDLIDTQNELILKHQEELEAIKNKNSQELDNIKLKHKQEIIDLKSQIKQLNDLLLQVNFDLYNKLKEVKRYEDIINSIKSLITDAQRDYCFNFFNPTLLLESLMMIFNLQNYHNE